MANTQTNIEIDKGVNLSNILSLEDFLLAATPVGSHARGIANNLYGLAHNSTRSPVPMNKDSYGLTFFTRPQLCFVDRNLRNDRMFYNLLTTNPYSVGRYVRCMLDPRMSVTSRVSCPFVDDRLGFIPILTNNITAISGWPDINMDTHTSKQGVRREAWSVADAPIDVLDAFDINCTFRNTKDEPIIMLFYYWIRYMALVFDGTFSPYLDFILENEIDYNTRIYRIVLDEHQRFVKKIAATGASFPLNVPYARFFDFNDTSPYNLQTKDIDITFKCNGATYNDPILIDEFNAVQGIFNGDMRINERGGNVDFSSRGMEKIPPELKDQFNYRGYPYINPDTLELEWWLPRDHPRSRLIKNAYGGAGNGTN